MFCDLVGSTELSVRLDPEDLREVIGAYHRACATLIESSGGYVAQYLGDGVMAYFGYPRANEDDPARAIRAALEIVVAVPGLDTRHGEPLAVRIGVATGLVVVGELIGVGGSEQRAVAGETPNLAARLQGLAPPNGLVVCQATRGLAGEMFDYVALGAVSLKGLSRPEPAWEVTRAKAVADRFGARHGAPVGSMVDRVAELAVIEGLWRDRATGRGHVVGVAGDPGIGKSRLVHEFRKRLAQDRYVWIEGGGAEVFNNTPFHAVTQMIRRTLARQGETSPEADLAGLERVLRSAGMDVGDSVDLLADLIGLKAGGGAAPASAAEQRRRRLIATLSEWILSTARLWPTILLVEDLHWIDPSSLELLDRLVAEGPAAGLFILYTTRTGLEALWPACPEHARLWLDRLDAEDTAQLILSTAGRGVPGDLLRHVVSRADGVPLFAEELARALVEGGDTAANGDVPGSLSNLLMARLDRLGPARQVAQIASISGREFRYDFVLALSDMAEVDVAAAIDALVAAGIVTKSGARLEQPYRFRHSLIQDAAYNMMLRSRRRALHGRAATVLEQQFPDIAASRPEVVARHWAQAGEHLEAMAAWRKAGQVASARWAFKEAQAAYRQAIESLKSAGDTPDAASHEMRLQGALAGAMQITRGYSDPETIAATARARELAEQVGDVAQQLRQVGAQWAAASSAGHYRAAITLADDIMPLARADGRPANLGFAHMVQMTARYRIGDFAGAERWFVDGEPYFGLADYVRRPGAVAQTYGNSAQNAWVLDATAEAERRAELAAALSLETGSPFDLAFTRGMVGMLRVLMGDQAQAAELARLSLDDCERHVFPQIAPISKIVLGRSMVDRGDGGKAVALIRDGLIEMVEIRSRVAGSLYRAWLAEALDFAGFPDEALEVYGEALSFNPDERFFHPEILRLRGECLSRAGAHEAAEIDILAAIDASKATGAARFARLAAASLERVRLRPSRSPRR